MLALILSAAVVGQGPPPPIPIEAPTYITSAGSPPAGQFAGVTIGAESTPQAPMKVIPSPQAPSKVVPSAQWRPATAPVICATGQCPMPVAYAPAPCAPPPCAPCAPAPCYTEVRVKVIHRERPRLFARLFTRCHGGGACYSGGCYSGH